MAAMTMTRARWVEPEPPEQIELAKLDQLPPEIVEAASEFSVAITGPYFGADYRIADVHGTKAPYTLYLERVEFVPDEDHVLDDEDDPGDGQADDPEELPTRVFGPTIGTETPRFAGLPSLPEPQRADLTRALGYGELERRMERVRAEVEELTARALELESVAEFLGPQSSKWGEAAIDAPTLFGEDVHFLFFRGPFVRAPTDPEDPNFGTRSSIAEYSALGFLDRAAEGAFRLATEWLDGIFNKIAGELLDDADKLVSKKIPSNPGYPGGKWEYDPDSAIPRRLMLQTVDTAMPEISPQWRARYLRLTMTRSRKDRINRRTRLACVRSFIHRDLMSPLAGTALKLQPIASRAHSKVSGVQASFAPNLTRKNATLSRSDPFFVDRVLNGFYPCQFLRDTAAGNGNQFVKVEFRWDPCEMEGAYELPNATAHFERVQGAGGDVKLEVRSIDIQFRDKRDKTGVRFPRMAPMRTWKPGDGEGWSFAKRCFRTAYLVAGEVDGHLSQGHLLTEQYLIPLMIHLNSKHALFRLLYPHLRDADAVNHFGGPVIFGRHSVLRQASAMSATDILGRFKHRMGSLDWYGWSPRRAICSHDRYASAAALYWGVVTDYVRAYFAKHNTQLTAELSKAKVFGATASRKAVRFARLFGKKSTDWWDTNEVPATKRYGTGGARTKRSSAVHKVRDMADLEQLCRYVIFHSSFYHSWSHDRQMEDGGEIAYASFGIRHREPYVPAQWTSRRAYQERLWPTHADAGYQLFVGDTLVGIDIGYIGAIREKDDLSWERHADHLGGLWNRLKARRADFARQQVDIKTLRSRTNT